MVYQSVLLRKRKQKLREIVWNIQSAHISMILNLLATILRPIQKGQKFSYHSKDVDKIRLATT